LVTVAMNRANPTGSIRLFAGEAAFSFTTGMP
jgi:hypothetical protein